MSLSRMDKETKRLIAELAEFGILPERPISKKKETEG